LATLFDLVSERLRIEFDYQAKILGHPGEIGTGRENVLKSILTKYIPKRYAVDSGFVIDTSIGKSEQIQKMALTKRIGNGIVLLSVLGFFLGMGIIFGITQAEKTYIPIISWFFPSVFLTGIQLFLLCMMLFLGLTLWALVHDLTKKKKLMEKSKA